MYQINKIDSFLGALMQNSSNGNWVKFCDWAKRNKSCLLYLFFILYLVAGLVVLYLELLPFPSLLFCFRIACFGIIFLLGIGLFGLWLPNTHLYHQFVFRFMAIFSAISLILLILFPFFEKALHLIVSGN